MCGLKGVLCNSLDHTTASMLRFVVVVVFLGLDWGLLLLLLLVSFLNFVLEVVSMAEDGSKGTGA